MEDQSRRYLLSSLLKARTNINIMYINIHIVDSESNANVQVYVLAQRAICITSNYLYL